MGLVIMNIFKSINMLLRKFVVILKNEDMRSILFLMVITLFVGTMGFFLIEGFSIFNSFYLSFITLTTIGFGDIHPVTTLGKIFLIIYGTFGMGVMSIFISSLVKYYIHSHESHKRHESDKHKT
ncbi:ion channel family protein [Enterococcus mundtii]|nr:ion channel family protein [Enterococcus mundtii]STE38149.1 ion channel family protein [Enterococcus mundtii]